MTSVAREMRHTKQRRCPICDGADGDPRGAGKRCSGFTSNDGSYSHCSREDLAGSIDANNAGLFAHRMRGSCKCGVSHGPGPSAVDDVEAVYPYTNERGALLFEVVRKTGKRFVQRRPDGAGGHVYKLDGVRRVLYGLPALVEDDADRTVHICEGEKDVNSLTQRGFLATCNPCGAGQWGAVADLARDVLRGRDVVVVADADAIGRKHARDVAASLEKVARSIRVVEPPTPHKDVSDLFAGGGSLDLLVPVTDTTAALATTASTAIVTTSEPPTLWASEIAKPLPPLVWTSESLTIVSGRATVLAGLGGTRKGWFAMELQLCGAAGRKFLGRFDLRDGLRSVYFDYEQTERPTRERFQLLASGHQIELGSLEKRLGYRWKPVPTWAPKTAVERDEAISILAWHTEGLDLAIVDSVRACSFGVDENSVFASVPMDLATEVSNRTGVTIMFLDHAGKPDATSGRTRRHAQRGHSSKTDAAQTLFVFSGEKGQPTLVTCERSQLAAEDAWPKDFKFALARANGGIKLQEIGLEETSGTHPERDLDQLCGAFVTDLISHPGSTIDEVVKRLGRRAADCKAARDSLERTRRIENRGSKGRPKWFATGGTP